MDLVEFKNRIRNAIILIDDGHSFRVGDITFSCKDKIHFIVSGWTHNNLLENVTKHSALAELNDIKSLFSRMVEASDELADFIKDRQIDYSFGYDYGMGSIGICSEKSGQLKWETEVCD